jgi:antitoxin HicB
MVAAGKTVGAAARLVPDAIDSWIDGALEAGIPVPEPPKADEEYSGRFLVRLTKTLHRRLAERAALEGVSLNSLCLSILSGGVEASGSTPVRVRMPSRGTNVQLERFSEDLYRLLVNSEANVAATAVHGNSFAFTNTGLMDVKIRRLAPQGAWREVGRTTHEEPVEYGMTERLTNSIDASFLHGEAVTALVEVK